VCFSIWQTQKQIFKSQARKSARLYSLAHPSPKTVKIPTAMRRFCCPFPLVESALGQKLFIHDCLVDVRDQTKKLHYFHIFFTRHAHQPINPSIKKLGRNRNWHGQLLVMKRDRRGSSLVNLKRCDDTLADLTVRRCNFSAPNYLTTILTHFQICGPCYMPRVGFASRSRSRKEVTLGLRKW
jgi:hypothetical protein